MRLAAAAINVIRWKKLAQAAARELGTGT